MEEREENNGSYCSAIPEEENGYNKWFREGEDQHIFLIICSDSGKASKEVISHCKVRVFRIDKNLEKIKYVNALG